MNRKIFALLRSLGVSALFISLWTWFVPRWIAGAPLDAHWRPPAIALMILGGAIMLRCIIDFGWSGEGTPAPFDPPRKFVVRALYRYMRNPMYAGMGVFLLGEALLLRSITHDMLVEIVVFFVMANLFIWLHEEPALREKFGDDYREYCRNVRRWVPRLTPFDKQNGGA